MKQETSYLTLDVDQVKSNCCEEIAEFGEQFEVLHKMYYAMGLYYPEECVTNYRDSWFHYRKLNIKKDDIAILNEKYGLEEHLLRAAKDAQIGFLQQLGYWLEIWYQHEKRMKCDLTNVEQYEKLFENLGENWVQSVEEASKGNNRLFAHACLYRFQTHIHSKDIQNKLQVLVHSMKNLILDLRLSGVEITRPSDNVYYLKKCVSVYNDMCASLKKIGMIYLIPAAGVIYDECKCMTVSTE